jgi:hypothetical protein
MLFVLILGWLKVAVNPVGKFLNSRNISLGQIWEAVILLREPQSQLSARKVLSYVP